MPENTPRLERITIFPIKSLDPVTRERTTIVENGALAHDREFAIFDENDEYVHGKRDARIHRIRTDYDLQTHEVTLREEGTNDRVRFDLLNEREAANAWLSEFFDEPVELRRKSDGGFPDVTSYASGPTLISTGTLQAVASWFPGLSVDETRLRFRSNLEVSGVPAFWEDRLYTGEERVVTFQIGNVPFEGVHPTPRCVVPLRDPKTGERYDGFQETFVRKREETLPEWADESALDHYFCLMVNTVVPPSGEGMELRVGDEVTVIGKEKRRAEK